MAFDVFISHSSKDKQVADATCAALEAAGIRCWIAPRDVRSGIQYAVAIIEAIDACRIMVVIVSSNSNESRQVPREVERAVSKGVTIIPMRIEDVVPQQAMEYFLDSIHWLDAITPPLNQHLQHLVADINALLQVDAGAAAPLSPLKRPGVAAIAVAAPQRKFALSKTVLGFTATAVLALAIIGGGAFALFANFGRAPEITGVSGGYVGTFTLSNRPGVARLSFLDVMQHGDTLQVYWQTDTGGAGTATGTISGNGVANLTAEETTPGCEGKWTAILTFFSHDTVQTHLKGANACLGPEEVDGSATRSALANDVSKAFSLRRQGYEAKDNYAEALKAFEASNAILKDVAAKDKSKLWQHDLALSYYDMANALQQQNKPQAALANFRTGIDISKALVAADPHTPQWHDALVDGAEGVAYVTYDFLKVHQFQAALDAADEAIAIAPNRIWLYQTRAYALMFLGRLDEAQALFLKYAGQKNVYKDSSWEESVLADFSDFHAEGLNSPLMDNIEKRFTAGG